MIPEFCVKNGYAEEGQWAELPSPSSESASHSASALQITIPSPTRVMERKREGRNDRSSAANWPASKSDSIRPLARSRSSFSSEWAQNSISLSLSHNLRYFTPPLTLFRIASSSSSSVLTKMISFTFVHLSAALVCPPPPPPPSRSL